MAIGSILPKKDKKMDFIQENLKSMKSSSCYITILLIYYKCITI